MQDGVKVEILEPGDADEASMQVLSLREKIMAVA